jgi:hypothetical protein
VTDLSTKIAQRKHASLLKQARTEKNAAVKESQALRTLLSRSGLVNKETSGGLIKKRGRPPSKETMSRHAVRLQAASDAVECIKIIMGDDLPQSMVSVVAVAVEQDAKVRAALQLSGGLPQRMITVQDRRFKTGERVTPERMVSRKNAALWQAEKNLTNDSIKALRKAGGTGVIDEPDQLMKFLISQSDILPMPEFVPGGRWSAVWVVPEELFKKLFATAVVSENLRTSAPYHRSGELIYFWIGVSPCASCCAHVSDRVMAQTSSASLVGLSSMSSAGCHAW